MNFNLDLAVFWIPAVCLTYILLYRIQQNHPRVKCGQKFQVITRHSFKVFLIYIFPLLSQEDDEEIRRDESRTLAPSISLHVYECIELALVPSSDIERELEESSKLSVSGSGTKEETYTVKLFRGTFVVNPFEKLRLRSIVCVAVVSSENLSDIWNLKFLVQQKIKRHWNWSEIGHSSLEVWSYAVTRMRFFFFFSFLFFFLIGFFRNGEMRRLREQDRQTGTRTDEKVIGKQRQRGRETRGFCR